MSNVWDYFTTEQQEKLNIKIAQVRAEIGPQQLKNMSKESNETIIQLQLEMEAGRAPDHPEVVLLAKRLKCRQDVFDLDDPQIEEAIERFHMENPDQKDHGMDLKLYRYIEEAKLYI